MAAPFNAPTEVPTTSSGTISRSNSAWSIPTSDAPITPPPPRTKAKRGDWARGDEGGMVRGS